MGGVSATSAEDKYASCYPSTKTLNYYDCHTKHWYQKKSKAPKYGTKECDLAYACENKIDNPPPTATEISRCTYCKNAQYDRTCLVNPGKGC